MSWKVRGKRKSWPNSRVTNTLTFRWRV